MRAMFDVVKFKAKFMRLTEVVYVETLSTLYIERAQFYSVEGGVEANTICGSL
jgi:hypothetical protein